MIYVFGDYALDTRLYELRHSGESCPLGPQVFNVLAYLIAHRDRVVTKDELIEHLWPAQCVSDATVHQHVTTARKATGDSGRQQRFIKTLRSRGYRFIAPVEAHDDEALGRDGPVASEVAHHGARQILQPAAEAPPTRHGAFMGERKLVTVLCGTLANAGALVERLGFEALPRLRQALLDLVQQEVQPYHGTLQAVGNDSFLVLFGVPVALEDHARRAVLAGLALQRRLHQPYQDPRTQDDIAFEVRLGVHTGLCHGRQQRQRSAAATNGRGGGDAPGGPAAAARRAGDAARQCRHPAIGAWRDTQRRLRIDRHPRTAGAAQGLHDPCAGSRGVHPWAGRPGAP